MVPHCDTLFESQANRIEQSPRSAYIHVPFCTHRCGYCNFTLIAGREDLIDRYLQAMEMELGKLGHPREVDTLFVGGGTPTHLPADALEKLLGIVLRWFPLAVGGEFTLEANPTDLNRGHDHFFCELGVTRMSIGAQSFDIHKLRSLERNHTADDIIKAVESVRNLGIDLSMDLIFGAPGEQLETWSKDLSFALALAPDHVATYGLTVEKGTTFYNRLLHGDLSPVEEDLGLAMYVSAIDTLTAAGYEHYEVSNFAHREFRCRHNECYWTNGSYYAAGPGAARFVNGVREINHRSTTTYIKRVLAGNSPVAFRERLSPAAAAREQIVFGLRRMEGISLEAFRYETGFGIPQLLGAPLQKYLDAGLFTMEYDRLRLTRKGLLISDSIWPDFLAE